MARGAEAPVSTSPGSAPARRATSATGPSSSLSDRPPGAPPSSQYRANASRVKSSSNPSSRTYTAARMVFSVRNGNGRGNFMGSP